MRSIAWWHFQWPWRILTQFSRSRHFWSRMSQKYGVLGTKFLQNTNMKSYTIYRMVPLSMTLSALWHGFQGHDIFLESNIVKPARLKILHKIPNLDWLLNASRGFVSICWASCLNHGVPVEWFQWKLYTASNRLEWARGYVVPWYKLKLQDLMAVVVSFLAVGKAACLAV